MVLNIHLCLKAGFSLFFNTSKQYLPQLIHEHSLNVIIQHVPTDMNIFLLEMAIILYLFHDLVLLSLKSLPFNYQRLETPVLLLNFAANSCYNFCNSSSAFFRSWKCFAHFFIGCWKVNSLKDIIQLYINLSPNLITSYFYITLITIHQHSCIH